MANEIWERLQQDEAPLHLTEEQKEIIRAEIRAYDANPEDVITWDELKAELQAQVIR